MNELLFCSGMPMCGRITVFLIRRRVETCLSREHRKKSCKQKSFTGQCWSRVPRSGGSRPKPSRKRRRCWRQDEVTGMRWGNWSTWSSMPSSRLKTSECANQSLEIPEEYPFVAAVSASKKHDFTKESRENVVLLSGLGVVGDAHCGARVQHLYDIARPPTRPNLPA